MAMSVFFALLGILCWMLGFAVIVVGSTIMHEIVGMLVVINGTVLLLGGSVLEKLAIAKAATGHRFPPAVSPREPARP